MASTAPDGDPVQVPINFSDTHRARLSLYDDFTGIWSCRFSADGNEVVAGGSGKIFGLYLHSNPPSRLKSTFSLRSSSQPADSQNFCPQQRCE